MPLAANKPSILPNQSCFAAISIQPGLQLQLVDAIRKAPHPTDYRPTRLEVRFDGKLVLIQENGNVFYEAKGFAPTVSPKLITVYGDGELLFVKAMGEVFLCRIPISFSPQWVSYDAL